MQEEIYILTKETVNYPEKLKQIKNPPEKLYAMGNVELCNQSSIAIIGSRHASEKGLQRAYEFSAKLSLFPLTIISGLAQGIDTMAHKGCLDMKQNTIAVLGGGFYHIYPKENAFLLQEILQKNGLILSEYAPNEEVQSSHFLERNRIISGMSDGVFVVESGYRSGTSVTARIAKEQKKFVFCLPGDIDNRYSLGNNRLLQKGALLITNIQDIISILNNGEKKKTNKEKETIKLQIRQIEEKYEVLRNKETLGEKNTQNSNYKESMITKEIQKLPQNYQKIYAIVTKEAISNKEIYEKSNLSITEINTLLSILEMEQYIERLAGNQWRKKKI